MTYLFAATVRDFDFVCYPPMSVILCLLLSACVRDFVFTFVGQLNLSYPHPCRGSPTSLHLGPPFSSRDRITRPSMDPADPNSLRQALASHGHLLDQHEQYFHELKEAMLALTAQIGSLSVKVERRSEATAAEGSRPAGASPVLPASRPAGTVVFREPNIPHPPRYSGEIGGCDQFVHQCSLVLDQQPHTFPDDGAKVAFVISLLSGQAALWPMAVSKANPELRASFPAFLAEFRNVFDHPVIGKEAGSRLLDLRQAGSSVAEYSISFRVLAAESRYGEAALCGIFRRGLSPRIKDELAARDETSTLEELIGLAIRLDNRLRERRRERDEERRPEATATVAEPVSAASAGHAFDASTPDAFVVTPSGYRCRRIHAAGRRAPLGDGALERVVRPGMPVWWAVRTPIGQVLEAA
ncbi:uncharacterized protein LOC144048723 [Vanacampus margaritifer]